MHESGFSCIAPLFVPADRPDRFAKAAASGADAVIIDLEDAVPPDRKVRAREALSREMLPAVPTLLRINAASTEWFAGDVAAAVNLGVECLLLPKAETIDEVRKIHALAGPLHIVALIETATGLANARSVAA